MFGNEGNELLARAPKECGIFTVANGEEIRYDKIKEDVVDIKGVA